MILDDIKEKIAKLMALGQDPSANQFEAEAALRQASSLMRKHNLDIAEVAERSGAKPVYNWRTVLVPAQQGGAKKTITWLGTLAVGIAEFTDCHAAWKRSDQHGWCIAYSGDAVDVEYAVYLTKHLRDTVRAQSAAYFGTRAERETFRRAMVQRIRSRVAALRAETQEAMKAASVTSSYALVLVDRKIALRDERFGAPKYRTARNSRRFDASAHVAGQAAGDKVGFGRPLSHENRSLDVTA